MMRIVMELSQFEQLKSDICDKRCRFLYNANNVKVKSSGELKKVADQMEKICSECPFNRMS